MLDVGLREDFCREVIFNQDPSAENGPTQGSSGARAFHTEGAAGAIAPRREAAEHLLGTAGRAGELERREGGQEMRSEFASRTPRCTVCTLFCFFVGGQQRTQTTSAI